MINVPLNNNIIDGKPVNTIWTRFFIDLVNTASSGTSMSHNDLTDVTPNQHHNEVTVTDSSNINLVISGQNITADTVQDIGTGNSPTFNGLTLNSLTVSNASIGSADITTLTVGTGTITTLTATTATIEDIEITGNLELDITDNRLLYMDSGKVTGHADLRWNGTKLYANQLEVASGSYIGSSAQLDLLQLKSNELIVSGTAEINNSLFFEHTATSVKHKIVTSPYSLDFYANYDKYYGGKVLSLNMYHIGSSFAYVEHHVGELRVPNQWEIKSDGTRMALIFTAGSTDNIRLKNTTISSTFADSISGAILSVYGLLGVDGTLEVNGHVKGGTVYADNLTSGRIALATTDGMLTDNANFTCSSTTMTVYDLDVSTDLDVGGDLDVTGTITGTFDTGLTQYSVPFINSSGGLTEDTDLNFTSDILNTPNLALVDNGIAYFGTGKDVELVYDGTDFTIDTGAVNPSDLIVDCGTKKTLKLEEIVYEDLQVQMGNIADRGWFGSAYCEMQEYRTGVAIEFENSTSSGYKIKFNLQLTHSYKEGEDIELHLHLGNDSNTSGNAVFKLSYEWANMGSTYPSTATTVTKTISIAGTDGKHEYALISASLSGTGKQISSILLCTLERLAGDSSDTFGESVFIIGLDSHIPVNTMGSRQLGVK